MLDYLPLIIFLTVIFGSLFFLGRFLLKKYTLLKTGHRTMATVCDVEPYHLNLHQVKGRVPVIEFMSPEFSRIRMTSSFFCEEYTQDEKMKIGYQFEIIYDPYHIDEMEELSTLKGVIWTYVAVSVFPLFLLAMWIYTMIFIVK